MVSIYRYLKDYDTTFEYTVNPLHKATMIGIYGSKEKSRIEYESISEFVGKFNFPDTNKSFKAELLDYGKYLIDDEYEIEDLGILKDLIYEYANIEKHNSYLKLKD